MPPDEDTENMPGQEYIEDSFDFYKFDFRRSNSDTLELSNVLQPLSLSQQNIQAQLDEDLKLLDVSGSVKTEEKEACTRDQIPSYIQHHPPGLHLFKEDSSLIFQQSDLNLIRDFNWSGLSRLYKSGVDQKILTKMIRMQVGPPRNGQSCMDVPYAFRAYYIYGSWEYVWSTVGAFHMLL